MKTAAVLCVCCLLGALCLWLDVFDSSVFVRRSRCGEWTGAWQEIYIFANIAIFTAYVLIPTILVASVRSGVDRSNRITLRELVIGRYVYGAFILSCGLGHLFDGVLSFSWPAYRFFACWHMLTGIISLNAVAYTWFVRLKLAAVV